MFYVVQSNNLQFCCENLANVSNVTKWHFGEWLAKIRDFLEKSRIHYSQNFSLCPEWAAYFSPTQRVEIAINQHDAP